jgi:peptide/nickel transport system substrate-binding protein
MIAGDQAPKSGGTATWGVRRDPPAAFDMMVTTIWYDLHQIGSPIWGSGNLVRPCLDDVYKVCPAMAESWEQSGDFTQYTFKIRSNVAWHDGTPFTAEDARYWLELVFQGAKVGEKSRRPAWYADTMGKLDKVEVLDGNRARVTLKERNHLFLDVLKTPYFTLAHPRHLTQPQLQQGNVAVAPLDVKMLGTGPFKFVKYDKGSIAQMRRDDKYWEKDALGNQLPYLDGMDFAIFGSPASMDAAIRVGRLDGGSPGFGYILTQERYQAYSRDLGDRFYAIQVPSGFGATNGFGFNVLKPGPWQDVRVRRAIALWVDKHEAVVAVAGGFGYTGGLLNPANPFSNPDILTWPGWNPATKQQDRAEAKRLMAQAGYPNGGFSMSHNCLTTGGWRERCEFVQAQLTGLGIDLKLTLMDTAAWTPASHSLDYEAIQSAGGITSYLPEANEPGLTRYSLSKTTLAKHEDPKIAEFFDRLRASASFEQRVATWRELERYWYREQAYSVQLVGNLATIPYRSWVKGRLVGPEEIMSYMDFVTVWLDK